jgi:hypothetical protein
VRYLALSAVLACSSGVSSSGAAEAAYLGLDESIDKALTLGFDGFNAASSANIPTQETGGNISGSMVVTGQVDQGQSANKQMRLVETLTSYADADGGSAQGIVYTTADAGASLDLSLQAIPPPASVGGSLSGSLQGTYAMTGALTGDVTLSIQFAGSLKTDDAGVVARKPGSTQITGTATSSSGSYAVQITR